MSYRTSFRLAHCTSALAIAASLTLVGCGDSGSPTGSSGATGSTGSSSPSCPVDASPAKQIVTQTGAFAAAAVGDSVYFFAPDPKSGDGTLYKAPADGGTAMPVSFAGSGSSLRADADHVYYAAGQTIQRDGEAVFTGPEHVDNVEMALDAANYYILARETVGYTASIARLPRDGSAMMTTTVRNLPGGTSRTIAVDSSAVYVLVQEDTGANIVSVALDGSSTTTVAMDVYPRRFAVDATSLYYFKQAPTAATADLVKQAKTGGAATVLLSDLHSPDDVLVDGDSLYVLEDGAQLGEGRVQRISTTGDCGQVLATKEKVAYPVYTYSHLATSATRVFWANDAGIASVTK
jgi:hypothetical protein